MPSLLKNPQHKMILKKKWEDRYSYSLKLYIINKILTKMDENELFSPSIYNKAHKYLDD